jgi:uncharacterized protein YciI
MKHWILFYDYPPDYFERRAPLRPDHFVHAQRAVDAGSLLLAGAFPEEPHGGVLVFRADDASVAEEFARNDPYVLNGLVTSWRVREWTVVAGTLFTGAT